MKQAFLPLVATFIFSMLAFFQEIPEWVLPDTAPWWAVFLISLAWVGAKAADKFLAWKSAENTANREHELAVKKAELDTEKELAERINKILAEIKDGQRDLFDINRDLLRTLTQVSERYARQYPHLLTDGQRNDVID